MTLPLAILAFFAIALGVIGTPAWPWFQRVPRRPARARSIWHGFAEPGLAVLMVDVVADRACSGLGLGWWLYGDKSPSAEEPDALEQARAAGCGHALRDRVLCRRALRRDGDRVLRVVGARGRLARSPRVGRHRGGGGVALRPHGRG